MGRIAMRIERGVRVRVSSSSSCVSSCFARCRWDKPPSARDIPLPPPSPLSLPAGLVVPSAFPPTSLSLLLPPTSPTEQFPPNSRRPRRRLANDIEVSSYAPM